LSYVSEIIENKGLTMKFNKRKDNSPLMTRTYGNTGIEVTALGFGGMRFEKPEDIDHSAETVFHAFEKGITYFDTAPGYCSDKSEEAVGAAIKEMKKTGKPFVISTKSMKPDGNELRADLEKSLKRLNLDSIDFYHCWYILTMDDWEGRKSGGAVDEILKARDEGLIKHPAFSTHLPGKDVVKVIEEGHFNGVTLGYSAINFPYRQEGISAAAENGLGVVVMNPLGGGTIVNNGEAFSFIKRNPGQSIVEAALHFLWAHSEITVALVGCRNKHDVDEAVEAALTYEPYSNEDIEKIKNKVTHEFNQLCTSCMYCDVCPENIPVWKFVETANQVLLRSESSLEGRIRYHWGADPNEMEKCIECGQCESACTQHLPIMERFQILKQALKKEAESKDT